MIYGSNVSYMFVFIKFQNISISGSDTEVPRYIHIGLFYTQQQAVDRPNIAQFMSMLLITTMDLLRPKQPVFALQFLWMIITQSAIFGR